MSLALVLSAALAQTAVAGFDLERFAPNAAPGQTLTLGTADGLPEGTLFAMLGLQYEHEPLVLKVNGVRAGAVVGARVTTDLLVAFDVTRFLDVSLEAPLVFQGGDDLSAQGLARPPSVAMGSLHLEGRFAAVQERWGHPLDAALAVGLLLPTGSSAAFTKDPGAGVGVVPRLQAAKAWGPVRLGGEVAAAIRSSTVLSPSPGPPTDEVGSVFSVGLVASGSVRDAQGVVRLRGELSVRVLAPLTHAPASVEVLAGVRVPLPGGLIELDALGGPGLGHLPGTPAFRAMLGVALTPSVWAPRPPP